MAVAIDFSGTGHFEEKLRSSSRELICVFAPGSGQYDSYAETVKSDRESIDSDTKVADAGAETQDEHRSYTASKQSHVRQEYQRTKDTVKQAAEILGQIQAAE